MRIVFSQHAKADLEQIWQYVGFDEDNPDAADRILARIRDSIIQLRKFPKLGKRCDQLSDRVPHLRTLNVDGYVIYYRIEKSTIEVGRIIHSRRERERLIADWVQ